MVGTNVAIFNWKTGNNLFIIWTSAHKAGESWKVQSEQHPDFDFIADFFYDSKSR